MCSLHARDARSRSSACEGKRRVAAARAGLARRPRRRRARAAPRPRRVAAQHLGDAAHVVEANERVGDDEPALGQAAPVVRHRHGRLELRDEVVARGSRRPARRSARPPRRSSEARAAADERVAAEPALLDRLEQEARLAALAQAEVGPERGEEVGVEDAAGHGRFGQKKRPSAGLRSSGGGLSCAWLRRRLPPRSCARSTSSRSGEEVIGRPDASQAASGTRPEQHAVSSTPPPASRNLAWSSSLSGDGQADDVPEGRFRREERCRRGRPLPSRTRTRYSTELE